jgi:hypothetical protein
LAHRLHLSVSAALNSGDNPNKENDGKPSTSEVRVTIHEPVNRQIRTFTTSNKWSGQLAALQPGSEAEKKGVLKIMPVRWGAAYDGYTRLQDIHAYIHQFYDQLPTGSSTQRAREARFTAWSTLAQIITILAPSRTLATTLQRKDLCMGGAFYAVLQAYVTLLGKTFQVPQFSPTGVQVSIATIDATKLSSVALAVLVRLRWELEERIICSGFGDTALMAIRLDPLCGKNVLSGLDELRDRVRSRRIREAESAAHNAETTALHAASSAGASVYRAGLLAAGTGVAAVARGAATAAAGAPLDAARAKQVAAAAQEVAAMARDAPMSDMLRRADALLNAELQRLDTARAQADASERQSEPKRMRYGELQLPEDQDAPAPARVRGGNGGGGAGGGGGGGHRGSVEHHQLVAYRTDAGTAAADDTFDLFAWWRFRDTAAGAQASPCPLLAVIARRVLAMRPTSVDPERNFSDAGNLISAKRSRLHPIKVEVTLFVKSNYDLVSDLGEVPRLVNPVASMPCVYNPEFDDEVEESEAESGSEFDFVGDSSDSDAGV